MMNIGGYSMRKFLCVMSVVGMLVAMPVLAYTVDMEFPVAQPVASRDAAFYKSVTAAGTILHKTMHYQLPAYPFPAGTNPVSLGNSFRFKILIPPGVSMAAISAESGWWGGVKKGVIGYDAQLCISPLTRPTNGACSNPSAAGTYVFDSQLAGDEGLSHQLYPLNTSQTNGEVHPLINDRARYVYFIFSNNVLSTFQFMTMDIQMQVDNVSLYSSWLGTSSDSQPPSIPTGLTASAASATQVNLLWSASTDNVGVNSYKVYRNEVLIATLGNVTSYNNTGLTASTSYSYTVQACDSSGNCSNQSSAATATTSAPDTQSPSIPAGLVANTISGNRIDLTWLASTDNVGVSSYKVYRNGTLVETLGNVTAYSNTGLIAGTAYSYTVAACDASGNCSNQSATASATTTAPDSQAPTVPAGLTAAVAGSSQINLSWSASSDNVGVISYKVYRDGELIATLANTTSYNSTGLNASQIYSYKISACDAAGNCSDYSTTVTATTSQPASASVVVNTSGGIGALNLSVAINPAAGHSGNGNFYVLALIPRSIVPPYGALAFLSETGGWSVWAGGNFIPYKEASLSAQQAVTIWTGADLRWLEGTEFYAGYSAGSEFVLKKICALSGSGATGCQ